MYQNGDNYISSFDALPEIFKFNNLNEYFSLNYVLPLILSAGAGLTGFIFYFMNSKIPNVKDNT